ncbi:hypothetical protein NMY22_g514 [Coprinellus aureogranulatus]|nr:hypothetical protein NMY22_g514 [Coprinellus aureogranulatus]
MDFEMQAANGDTRAESPAREDQWAWKDGYTNMNYELPPVAKSIRDGLQGMYQSGAVVVSLCPIPVTVCTSSGSCHVTVRRDKPDAKRHHLDVVLRLHAPQHRSHDHRLPHDVDSSQDAILCGYTRYSAEPEFTFPPFFPNLALRQDGVDFIEAGMGNVGKSYNKLNVCLAPLRVHWFISLIAGSLTLSGAIILYIGAEERPSVTVVTVIIGFLAIFPLLWVTFFGFLDIVGSGWWVRVGGVRYYPLKLDPSLSLDMSGGYARRPRSPSDSH